MVSLDVKHHVYLLSFFINYLFSSHYLLFILHKNSSCAVRPTDYFVFIRFIKKRGDKANVDSFYGLV